MIDSLIKSQNNSITGLNLGGYNKITNEGAAELAKILKMKLSIKNFHIGIYPESNLQVLGNTLGTEGFKILSPTLKISKTLLVMSISNIGLGVEGSKELAAVLKENKSLGYIDIGTLFYLTMLQKKRL